MPEFKPDKLLFDPRINTCLPLFRRAHDKQYCQNVSTENRKALAHTVPMFVNAITLLNTLVDVTDRYAHSVRVTCNYIVGQYLPADTHPAVLDFYGFFLQSSIFKYIDFRGIDVSIVLPDTNTIGRQPVDGKYVLTDEERLALQSIFNVFGYSLVTDAIQTFDKEVIPTLIGMLLDDMHEQAGLPKDFVECVRTLCTESLTAKSTWRK